MDAKQLAVFVKVIAFYAAFVALASLVQLGLFWVLLP